MVTGQGFRVGLLSDESLLLDGQKEQGKLDAEETKILLDYIEAIMGDDSDENGDEDDDNDDDEEENYN